MDINKISGVLIVVASIINLISCLKGRNDEAGVVSRPLNNLNILYSILSIIVGFAMIIGWIVLF